MVLLERPDHLERGPAPHARPGVDPGVVVVPELAGEDTGAMALHGPRRAWRLRSRRPVPWGPTFMRPLSLQPNRQSDLPQALPGYIFEKIPPGDSNPRLCPRNRTICLVEIAHKQPSPPKTTARSFTTQILVPVVYALPRGSSTQESSACTKRALGKPLVPQTPRAPRTAPTLVVGPVCLCSYFPPRFMYSPSKRPRFKPRIVFTRFWDRCWGLPGCGIAGS